MTSATIRSARGASGRHGEGYWAIIFAALLLGVVGILNLIDGIAAIASWSCAHQRSAWWTAASSAA